MGIREIRKRIKKDNPIEIWNSELGCNVCEKNKRCYGISRVTNEFKDERESVFICRACVKALAK